MKIGGIVFQIVDTQDTPIVFFGVEMGEHTHDFTQVPEQSQNIVAVVGKAGPLGFVLYRRIPEEGIAHRRIGSMDIFRDDMVRRRADIQPSYTVEDHPDRIEPRGSPRLVFRQPIVHDGAVGQVPGFHIFMEFLSFLGRC